MADPISVSSGITALATFALQSSVTLRNTVRGFKSQDKNARALENELADLINVLESLLDTVGSNPSIDFEALSLPLKRCGKACEEYGDLIVRYTKHSTGLQPSFRGWVTQKYLQGDISDFKAMLGAYKSTIAIALANANISSSRVTEIIPNVLEDYQKMIIDTENDLRDHLQRLEEKVQSLTVEDAKGSPQDNIEWQAPLEEKKSIHQSIKIFAQLSAQIEQLEPASKGHPQFSQRHSAHKYTQDCIRATKGSIQASVSRLQSHENNIKRRIEALESTVPLPEHTQLAWLQDTKEIIRQCINIISDAGENLDIERRSAFEDITITGEAYDSLIPESNNDEDMNESDRKYVATGADSETTIIPLPSKTPNDEKCEQVDKIREDTGTTEKERKPTAVRLGYPSHLDHIIEDLDKSPQTQNSDVETWKEDAGSQGSDTQSNKGSLNLDAKSVFSIDTDSTYSKTSLGLSILTDQVVNAVSEQLADLLINQIHIESSCSEAMAANKIEPKKLQRNLKRLLVILAKELKSEAREPEDSIAINFIRFRASQIAHEICKRTNVGQMDQLTPTLNANPDKLRLVEEYLQNMKLESAIKSDSTELKNLEDNTSEDEMELEDDIEPWNPIKDDLANLTSIKRFVLNSEAFLNLRTRLYNFLYPTFHSKLQDIVRKACARISKGEELQNLTKRVKVRLSQLRELELDLEMADVSSISIHNHIRLTLWDTYTHALERYTHKEWDWWPFPRPHTPSNGNMACIHWTCSCGSRRFQNVPTEIAKSIQRLLDGLKIDNAAVNRRSHNPGRDSGPSSQSSQLPHSRIPPSRHKPFLSYPPRALQSPHAVDSTQARRVHARTSTNSPSTRYSWVFLAVSTWGDYRLVQIPVTNITDDTFFQILRARYLESRGFLHRFLSYNVFHHCEFAQIERIGQDVYEPTDSRPSFPELTDADYMFMPKPPNPMPPINHHEFNRRFYACHRTDKHFHFFNFLNILPGNKICGRYSGVSGALDRIPKRLRLLNMKAPNREAVWGLLAVELPSFYRVVMYHLLILVGPFVFWVLWLSVWGHDGDWQNAYVPFSAVCALLSIFWFPLVHKF